MHGPDHEIMQGMPLLRKHIRKALVGSAGASTSCSSLSWTSCRRLSKDTPLLQALAEILDEVRLCSESHGVYHIRGVRPLTNLTQAQECWCACNELRQACCNQAALSSVTASTGILEPDAARRHVCSLLLDGLTRPAAALSSSSRICTTLPCSPRTTSRRSWLGPTACATLKTSSGSSACARLAVRALALQIQLCRILRHTKHALTLAQTAYRLKQGASPQILQSSSAERSMVCMRSSTSSSVTTHCGQSPCFLWYTHCLQTLRRYLGVTQMAKV